MNGYFYLTNPVMEYDWGSHEAIQALLGEAYPAKRPKAELWMGAHPKAPSLVALHSGQRPLDELVRKYPEDILGSAVADRYSNQLPFLFKVLAARQPLSIQAHPGAERAKIGFERENQLGIPLTAPHRNYRDAHHKPECICAMSEFWALCGFRPPGEIAAGLQAVCPGSFTDEVALLKHSPAREAVPSFLAKLLRLDPPRRRQVIVEALAATASDAGDPENAPVAYWIHRLSDHFPEDICILAPVFLNLIRLKPAQALFLPAGCLHAYLRGTGIEIMASSDNVLRGGLTSKHVDVDELLKTVCFDPWRPQLIRPIRLGEAESQYPCPADEFTLSMLTIRPDAGYSSSAARNVEIFLCIQGTVTLASLPDAGHKVELKKGTSVLVPASAPAYLIEGSGLLYRAGVRA
jgi:mannose-6-phosphate isomerase